MKFLLLLVILVTLINCTFYLVAFDPLTRKWGHAASSSGYTSNFPDRNWWQHRVKNRYFFNSKIY